MKTTAHAKVSAGIISLGITWCTLSHAEDAAKQQCVRAYEAAQAEEHAGKLLDARKHLLFCSSAACPAVMHADCQGWLTQVEESLPTVVFRVTTSSGTVSQEATVTIDGGAPVVLDGRALSVDPGRHEVVFRAQGQRPLSKGFDFLEGEKLRREIVELESATLTEPSPSSPTEEPAKRGSKLRISLPVALAASTTVLGAVSATYFGLKARSDDTHLDTCTPNCNRDSIDRVKQEYLLTNISLGVAAMGAVTTAVLLLTQSPADPPSRSARLGMGASTNQFDLSLTGSF